MIMNVKINVWSSDFKKSRVQKVSIFFERRIDTLKKHFVITFLLMIFILIVHCAKEKKTNVKKNVYIGPLTKEMYDFLVYLVKIMVIATLRLKKGNLFRRTQL